MRINILTSGRFHVLDLARELSELGHEVRFYSHVPRWRAGRFGLPAECHRGLLPYAFPLVALARSGPRALRPLADRWMKRVMDAVAARTMAPCDVFIGMSGLAVASARAARERFGASIFIERGSRHIESQREILAAIEDAPERIHEEDVRREFGSYELADVVVVPSRHAEQSFLERGFAPSRLFRNPYGVDLRMFQPTPKPANPAPVILMAGAWSLRKGCDVLWEACRTRESWRLMHVGPLADAPLPRSPRFVHHDAVPQWRLARFCAEADVFALASREEGLSLVQAQALACGLPLVCTDRTGGEDLAAMLDDPGWVTVVPTDDVAALQRGIETALARAATQQGPRDILGAGRDRLSWRAYGRRYHERLAESRGVVQAVCDNAPRRREAHRNLDGKKTT